jgi:hypothetical protein
MTGRRALLSRQRLVIVMSMVAGSLLCSPAPATAQDCTLTYSGVDVSVPGSGRLQAGTNQQNCPPGIEVQVRARISNAVTPTCSKTMYGYWCGDNNSSGNAVNTTSQGCGTGQAFTAITR